MSTLLLFVALVGNTAMADVAADQQAITQSMKQIWGRLDSSLQI
ncbi:hypothetical protein [Pseudomonas sp. 21LCFQ010]|nr:hypothetical protein [Pseudomonas sp. 21LCFQ010]